MLYNHQDMLVCPSLEQCRAEHQILAEIKRTISYFRDGSPYVTLGTLLKIEKRQPDGPTFPDELNRVSTFIRSDIRTQHFVAFDNRIQCPVKSIDIEFSFEPERHRFVVRRRLRLKLIEKPQPLLSER